MRVLMSTITFLIICSCSTMNFEVIDTRDNAFGGRNGDFTGKINTDTSISISEKLVQVESNQFIVSGSFKEKDIVSIYRALPDKVRSKISSINQFKTFKEIESEYKSIYGSNVDPVLLQGLILYHGIMVFVDISGHETHVYSAKNINGTWVVELSYETVS